MDKMQIIQDKDKNFIENNFETTIKLLEVLAEIFSDEVLKDKLVLKGGGAVNFYLGNLARLFLDIDLDLKTPNETCINQEKEKISSQLLNIMENQNYKYSYKKSRHSYSLDSFCFPYKKRHGNLDYLKIEVNYSCSIHLYPNILLSEQESLIDKRISILDLNELIGMKLKALFDRTSVKDLFDIFQLINSYSSLDNQAIRKAFLFYYTLASLNYDHNIINKINNITKKDLISRLYPLISKKSGINLDIMKQNVWNFSHGILDFTDKEIEFYKSFQEGIYQPELLFENEQIIERAQQNPLAKYKIKLKRMT